MRLRAEMGLLVLLVGSVSLGVSCLGGPVGGSGAATTHGTPSQPIERALSVQVIDREWRPVEAAIVMASSDGVVLDQQMTIANGTATVRVADGALISVFWHAPSGRVVIQSVQALAADSEVQVRMLGDWPTRSPIRVSLLGTAGSFPAVVGVGSVVGSCDVAGTGSGPYPLDPAPERCGSEHDGSYSIWALSEPNLPSGPNLFAAQRDVASTTTALELVLTTTATASETFAVVHAPPSAQPGIFALAPRWNGQAITPSQHMPAVQGTAGTIDVMGLGLADSITGAFTFVDTAGKCALATYLVTPVSHSAWTLDASTEAPVVFSATLATNQGPGWSIDWTAGSGVAEAVYWYLAWTDTSGSAHTWLLDLEPPADGHGSFLLPVLPSGFGGIAKPEAFLSYRDLEYVSSYAETRALPSEPQSYWEHTSRFPFIQGASGSTTGLIPK